MINETHKFSTVGFPVTPYHESKDNPEVLADENGQVEFTMTGVVKAQDTILAVSKYPIDMARRIAWIFKGETDPISVEYKSRVQHGQTGSKTGRWIYFRIGWAMK